MLLIGSYNPLLVLLSIFVAVLASYVALDMAGRISATQGRAARFWLVGGATAMGIGIWSMHFIGMLAFTLPIPLGYDPTITFISLLIAIVSSGFGLWLGCQNELPWYRLIAGAMLMGAGINGMHYTGMFALKMAPAIHYDPFYFILSVLVAILASGAALKMAHYLRRFPPRISVMRTGAAGVMGLGITLMHYLGMKAAQFSTDSVCLAASVHTDWLALVIIIFTLAVLTIALIVSILDSRYEERTFKLTQLALHDTLTQLPNRLLLTDRVEQAMRHAGRMHKRFALMFIDLDGFKGVNDTYGHQAGDQLLVEVARRIQALVRTQDTVARVGGDEFVLVAEVAEEADASVIADKLVQTIRQSFHIAGYPVRISTSLGIAMYPGDGRSQYELLANADAAMYYAKSLGKNAYYFFSEMGQAVRRSNVRSIRR